jgi:hypothetical protein
VSRLGNLLFQVGLGEERGTHQAVWAGWHGLGDEWAVGIFEVGGFTEAGEGGWIREGGRMGGVWLGAVEACLQRLRTPDAVINGCMIPQAPWNRIFSLLNPNSAAFLVSKRLAVHNAVDIAISDDRPVLPLLAHHERQLPAFEEEYGIALSRVLWS